MHIYESPFYYIDYTLAQTVALGFLIEMRKDYENALDRYVAFAKKEAPSRSANWLPKQGLQTRSATARLTPSLPKYLKS